MPLFLLLLTFLALTAVLIKALHASQVKKARDNAAQAMPLPSLSVDNNDQEISREIITVVPEITTAASRSTSWQDEVKALRDSGRFNEALTLCSRQYPRMFAFRQTMITLRTQMKSGDETPEQALKDIYRTAILADLVKASPNALTEHDISKELPELAEPRNYWNQLGYKNLALLSKTDRSLLIKYWGEPGHHNDITLLTNKTE